LVKDSLSSGNSLLGFGVLPKTTGCACSNDQHPKILKMSVRYCYCF